MFSEQNDNTLQQVRDAMWAYDIYKYDSIPSMGDTVEAAPTIYQCRPCDRRGPPAGRVPPAAVRSGRRLPWSHPCPQYFCAAEGNSVAE